MTTSTTAAVQLTFVSDTASVTLVGAAAELRGPEMYLDDKRVARWRHDLMSWVDEHGRSYSDIKIEAVS